MFGPLPGDSDYDPILDGPDLDPTPIDPLPGDEGWED